MLSALQDYLLSVTAAAFLAALIQSVLSEGSAKRVCAFACTLALFLVVTQPLGRSDFSALRGSFEAYWAQLQDYPQELEEVNLSLTEELIVSRARSYIMNRAQEAGVTCAVEITCAERSGIAVPVEAQVFGVLSAAQRGTVENIIREGFGQEMRITFGEEGTDGAA